jgi:hypothetical protein
MSKRVKLEVEESMFDSNAEVFNYMVESLTKYVNYHPDDRKGLAITPNVEDNVIYIQLGYFQGESGNDYRFSIEFPEPIESVGDGHYQITRPFGTLINFQGQTYDVDNMFLPYMFQVLTKLHLYSTEDSPMHKFWGKLNNPKIVAVFY